MNIKEKKIKQIKQIKLYETDIDVSLAHKKICELSPNDVPLKIQEGIKKDLNYIVKHNLNLNFIHEGVSYGPNSGNTNVFNVYYWLNLVNFITQLENKILYINSIFSTIEKDFQEEIK